MTCAFTLEAIYLLGTAEFLRGGVAARAGASSRTDTHRRYETGTERRGTPGNRRSLSVPAQRERVTSQLPSDAAKTNRSM
ncbi:hypothetical protein QQF64_029026 [Cirrhinus molitorella]|uniref:Secreted protein n=1 Tax=Cirrhinus molitorella TaxID=172907 RepID=A0ABR3N892_9TELE